MAPYHMLVATALPVEVLLIIILTAPAAAHIVEHHEQNRGGQTSTVRARGV
jgi:hypothetical protein